MEPYINGRIEIVVGDITTLAVDAIVNAANAALSGGGGVDGAIHRAAGPQLLAACRALGRCPPGEARMTDGFRLPAKKVIHAVGPVWDGGTRGEDAVLASAYRSSMQLMCGTELASIAFPAISTGVYGFPIERATKIAIATVLRELREHACADRVVFCCYSERDGEIYHRVAERTISAES